MEVLPTGGWGYEVLPFTIRYARTLGKPYVTMTGRFHKSWGDFGGLRTYHSLIFDCYNSIANGGACMVGDHMHPRGRLDRPVYELIGRVYDETKKLDAWTDGQIPVAELAVVEPAMKGFPGRMECFSPVAGAVRMLSELKQQFDVVDGSGDLRRYRGLILPDTVTIEAALGRKLSAHLKRGGFIISSGQSGLNPENIFALKEYGLINEGPEPCNPTFLRAREAVAAGIPDMPVTVYSQGIAVTPEKGTAVLADLWTPYFNHGCFDRYHEYLYTPPEKAAGRPALTKRGSVLHFAFPVFSGYFDHAVVAYKQLVANCLRLVHPEPLIRAENLPSFAQVTVARQDRRTLVHILTYLPELRGPHMQAIEEPMEISDAVVSLRTGGRKINRVYSAPSRAPLAWEEKDGYVTVTIQSVRGYHLVVIE